MSSLPVLNTLLNLKLAGNLAAASAPANSDYRALVCLYFGGGIDSFNVLTPRSNAEYATYAKVRDKLALPQASLLPINPLTDPGLQLGLHPKLPGLQGLFENQNAAFIANVGTLLDTTVTVDQFNNGGGKFPLGLFSHSDQTEQWQTSTPDIHSSQGWGGRVADALHSLNSKQAVSMNISLSGGNIWQSGENIFAYAVGPDQATPLTDFDPTVTDSSNPNYNPGSVTYARTLAVTRQLNLSYQHLLTEEFAGRRHSAIDTYQLYNNATSKVTLPSTVNFNEANNYLGYQLQMVAKAIAAHSDLGHVRQTFYVEIDGWDMHSKLIAGLNDPQYGLPAVNEAITAFYSCLATLGLDKNVTTFSASDFARTLSSNGDGADHAWGSNQFVFGGAVNGKQIYGQYPDLAENGPLDVGRGRFIPTTPVDVYFAEMALWLGVSKSDLPLVLPNIGKFYDPTSLASPMGFLA